MHKEGLVEMTTQLLAKQARAGEHKGRFGGDGGTIIAAMVRSQVLRCCVNGYVTAQPVLTFGTFGLPVGPCCEVPRRAGVNPFVWKSVAFAILQRLPNT